MIQLLQMHFYMMLWETKLITKNASSLELYKTRAPGETTKICITNLFSLNFFTFHFSECLRKLYLCIINITPTMNVYTDRRISSNLDTSLLLDFASGFGLHDTLCQFMCEVICCCIWWVSLCLIGLIHFTLTGRISTCFLHVFYKLFIAFRNKSNIREFFNKRETWRK